MCQKIESPAFKIAKRLHNFKMKICSKQEKFLFCVHYPLNWNYEHLDSFILENRFYGFYDIRYD